MTVVAKAIGWNDMRVRRKVAIAIDHGWLVNREEKRRRPADLWLGTETPKSRGLPTKESLLVVLQGIPQGIPPQIGCCRVDSSNGAGFASTADANDSNNGVNSDDADNSANKRGVDSEANENGQSTRQHVFRGEIDGINDNDRVVGVTAPHNGKGKVLTRRYDAKNFEGYEALQVPAPSEHPVTRVRRTVIL